LPDFPDVERTNEMMRRALYPYLKPSRVYCCPEDKGKNYLPDGINYGPTLFHAFGCSYQLNTAPWVYTRHPYKECLPRQQEGWVKQPSKYVLVYEPPARPTWKIVNTNPCNLNVVSVQYRFHWHFNIDLSTVNHWQFAGDQQKYISPVLFVDGHVARHDFTRSLKKDPRYPTEETSDWMWYQPVEDR
jgi:prepilin-type processing-associated H-X9-DG protein